MHLYPCSVSDTGFHIMCHCPLRGFVELWRVRERPSVLDCPFDPDDSVSTLPTGRTFGKKSSLD